MSFSMHERKKARLNLVAIALVAAMPLVASYLLYLLWKPARFVNYGELFGPLPLVDAQVPAAVSALKGKWLFVMSDSGACDTYCARKLYIMRQVRLTQGQDQERIERVWLLEDDKMPEPKLVTEYAGTRLVPAQNSELLRRLAQGSPS